MVIGNPVILEQSHAHNASDLWDRGSTIFKEFIILLRLFGLEVPNTAESLDMVFMPGRRLRSASSQQMAEVTKYVGCAVASTIAGCGEAYLISEHRSNTIGLQLHTTDLQQHYLFCAGHGLQIEHRFGAMIIEEQDVQHRTMREQYRSEPWGEPYRSGLGTVRATFE